MIFGACSVVVHETERIDVCCYFFFSSRRRHTRLQGDWSSDVCSSDLLVYEALTGDERRALPAAAAIELLHNFTLIHDDIEDQDPARHHRPTVWSVWGVPQAINAGDGMFAVSRLAVQLLRGFPAEPVLA